jgi:anti-anti-sigma factor
MMTYPPLGRLDVAQAGDATVARLSVDRSWTQEAVGALGAELARLAGPPGCRLVLDLSRVEFFPSLLLGQLVALHRKVRSGGGVLVLSGLSPQVALVLERTRLERIFTICRDEEEALRALRDAG